MLGLQLQELSGSVDDDDDDDDEVYSARRR